MTKPYVTILLATYNGARHLPDQLVSLAAQTHRPDKVVVRDDGSSDESLQLILDWGKTERIIVDIVPSGKRLGPAYSFLSALKAAGPADIYFFCDQDDFWLPDKIKRAVDVIQKSHPDLPHLHATRLIVVDANLNPLRNSPIPTELSFASAACESVLTGCTMAFNAALAHRLSEKPPKFMVMHDWWAYLVATGCGYVSYDPQPSLLYRQHSSNTLGAGPRGFARLKTRVKTFLGPESNQRSQQLLELIRIHGGKLTPSARQLALMLTDGVQNSKLRWHVSLHAPIHRQSFMSLLSTRFSLLTNRF